MPPGGTSHPTPDGQEDLCQSGRPGYSHYIQDRLTRPVLTSYVQGLSLFSLVPHVGCKRCISD